MENFLSSTFQRTSKYREINGASSANVMETGSEQKASSFDDEFTYMI